MLIEEPLKENALERVDTKENVFDDLRAEEPRYTATALSFVSKNRYYIALICALLSYVVTFTSIALFGGKSTVMSNREKIAQYFEAPLEFSDRYPLNFQEDDIWSSNQKFVNYVTIEGYEEEDYPLLIAEVLSNVALEFDVKEEAIIYMKFSAFNNRYRKVHKSWSEKRHAFKNFRTNLSEIADHNMNKDRTFDKRMNVFGDLSPEEFLEKYTRKVEMDFPELSLSSEQPHVVIPADNDLRRTFLTGIKIQPESTPAWAYVATSIAEAYIKSSFTTTISLSADQLIEELVEAHGSSIPNNPLLALKHIKEEGLYESRIYNKIKQEREEAAESTDSTEQASLLQPNDIRYRISNFSFSYNPDIVKMLQNGPVASCIAINADWQFYRKGVITTCGLEPNHFVTIAGVGHDDNGNYWLVKNSFGYRWGDSGYAKVRRGNRDSETDCGILLVAFNSFSD